MHYLLRELPFAILWLAWLAYWIAAAHGVKPTRRRETLASQIIASTLYILAAALLAVPGNLFPWFDARFLPAGPLTYCLGLLLVVLGLGFTVWARIHLAGNWSIAAGVKTNHELIRSGPYALVRHPIYSGMLLAILGTAIAFGEWRGLAAFALLTLAFLRKMRREEWFMGEIFPEAYRRYRAEVPALIPFIGRGH